MKVIILFMLVGSSLCLENSGSSDDNVWPSFLRVIGIMGDLYPDVGAQCRVNYKHIYSFECEPDLTAGPLATSVHRLRPQDISVIGAIGDSLTAGFGSDACTVAELPNEYREGHGHPLSQSPFETNDGDMLTTYFDSIGGDDTIEEVSTLPNILKEFNPNLKGFSTGVGPSDSEVAGFNTAISGAHSELLTSMTNEMITRMKAHEEVDFEADWKTVSVFIGTNDLCQYCFNFHKYSAEQSVHYMKEALDIMHNEMPRTLVNVQGILRINDVDHLNSLNCDLSHLITCNCAMFRDGEKHQELVDLVQSYQTFTEDLIMSGRYDTRDDFTVVYQPYLTKTRFGIPPDTEGPGSYFAPDCFHFGAKGHATLAKELWNNMLQPVGQKSDSWNPPENINCPTKDQPYIFTNMNSDIDVEQYPYYAEGSGTAVHLSLLTMLLSLGFYLCSKP